MNSSKKDDVKREKNAFRRKTKLIFAKILDKESAS